MTFLGEGDRPEGTFKRLTVSWMDPHTTQKRPRTCKDCHKDPRAIGLGRGNLVFVNGKWKFEPSMSRSPKTLGIQHPLDQFVTIDGDPLVNFSRAGRLRTFNGDEIDRILTVGICLECHSDLSFSNIRPIKSTSLEALKCSGLKQIRK